VALQETKLDFVDDLVVAETLGNNFVSNYVVLPALGTSGGILLAVDENFFSITRWEIGVHSITALITEATGSVSWCITTVYGPQDDLQNCNFWGRSDGFSIVCLLCLTNGL
jgi:hypothetical protein